MLHSIACPRQNVYSELWISLIKIALTPKKSETPFSRKAISRSQSKEQHLLGNKYNAVTSNWTVVA